MFCFYLLSWSIQLLHMRSTAHLGSLHALHCKHASYLHPSLQQARTFLGRLGLRHNLIRILSRSIDDVDPKDQWLTKSPKSPQSPAESFWDQMLFAKRAWPIWQRRGAAFVWQNRGAIIFAPPAEASRALESMLKAYISGAHSVPALGKQVRQHV